MTFNMDKFHPLFNSSLDKEEITNLRSIVDHIEPGFACGQHNSEGVGIVHLRPYNINSNGEMIYSEDKFVPTNFDRKRTKVNDVIFNNTNSPELVGKTSLIEDNFANQAFSNHMYRIEISKRAYPKFIAMQLHFLFLSGYFRHKCTNHVNQASISQIDLLDNTPLFLPSKNRQKEIVAQIETLTMSLEFGLKQQEIAEKKLELYRQSVLKEAFEGRLTADWRAANPDKVEPADKLLARIQAERKAAHQAELDAWENAFKQWEANDKKGKKPAKPTSIASKFELINKDNANNEDIFQWDQICLGDLFGVFVGSTPKRNNPKYWDGSVNWISSGEVDFCYVDSTKETITSMGLDETSTKLHPPGTLFLAMIGEGKTRGKAAISTIEAAHNQNTAAIRISETSLLPEFYYFFMMYNYEITRTIGSGNNQKALNKSRVEAIKVPLTSVNEQKEVIKKLNISLNYIDNTKNLLREAENKAQALKKSILKQVFADSA